MLQDRPGCEIPAILAKTVPGRTVASYEKNQTIFSQGDPADSVFYIQAGTVLTKVLSCQGKEAIIGILSAGDFFGEGCLAGQPRRMSTAAALSKCTVVRLEKSAMLRLLHDDPPFSGMFMQYLLSRNTRIEEDLVDHFFNYSEKRLARVLIRLANLRKISDHSFPKITQAMLAEIVGTTRARVSFFMNRFRELRLIDYNPGLHVYNALEKFVQTPQESSRPDDGFELDEDLETMRRQRITTLFARSADKPLSQPVRAQQQAAS
jgi:CRP/FNR family cyclic AMP-dependent transcriptional regulator